MSLSDTKNPTTGSPSFTCSNGIGGRLTTPAPTLPITPAALLAAGFTASVNITLGGVAYTASANSLLASGSPTSWLAGSLANEWLVSAPLKLVASPYTAHPHLQARFAIRTYTGLDQAKGLYSITGR